MKSRKAGVREACILALAALTALQGCGSGPVRKEVKDMAAPCYQIRGFALKRDHVEHPFDGRACLFNDKGEDWIVVEASILGKDRKPRTWTYKAAEVESLTLEKVRTVGNPWWKEKKVQMAGAVLLGGLIVFSAMILALPDNHPH